MKLHFLLVGGVAMGLLISAPDSMAHGGGGFGGGGGRGGGGGNLFHGGGHFGGQFHGGGFHGGRGRFFHRGRFFGPGFAFYGYGYPWWWDWDYPYYSAGYYGYDPYYSGSYEGDHDPRLTSTRAVQAALAWQGYYSGRIDGVMGPETREAIRAFQQNRGLPVTGRIDSGLIDALRR